jgi:hypothetical protein
MRTSTSAAGISSYALHLTAEGGVVSGEETPASGWAVTYIQQ